MSSTLTTGAPRREASALAHLREAAVELGAGAGWKFPWREEPTWHRTLTAEVLLQHTPAKRVEPVFRVVVQRWPTFAALSRAEPAEVEAVLEPLGLQRRRAAALVGGAARITSEWDGAPAADLAAVSTLPGVGRYTAGVVVSVAGERPAAFVDGPIARLLRRYFGLPRHQRVDSDREVWARAAALPPATGTRAFAWGLIDLAREVCRPQPDCVRCPVRAFCREART